MPVLEWAVPAATLVFLPLLLGAHYARVPLRWVSQAASRLPLSGFGPLDSFLTAATSDPDEIAAVLHGVLLGPIAPTIEQRRAITAPALVLGHGIDLIHSFSDAQRLARQLPDARLIRTRTFAELWVACPSDRRDQRFPRPRLGARRTAGATRQSLVKWEAH
jgi:pimeloyl-ACP methyl ester carboxylesterase